MDKLSDFGLVGLGVMGRNFILNVADHDFSVIGLDTDPGKVEALLEEAKNSPVSGTSDILEFVKSLAQPRRIMLLVPAGNAVDTVIGELLPLLSSEDLIIDGGNSYFQDTERRIKELEAHQFDFIGAGVSGGAKGARFGPSIMPGGSREAYEKVRFIFEAVAAKANGEPCVEYIGSQSAGHYVKMVHNGIEYALMQLIAEVYDVLKRGVGLSNIEIAETFNKWNNSRLQSYLIEITAEIFKTKDTHAGGDLVDMILDKAMQKDTGKWTSQNSMDLGIPVPAIDAAVNMRELSAMKNDRMSAEKIYNGPRQDSAPPTIEEIEKTLFFSYLIAFAQGFTLLSVASQEYNYGLNLDSIASIWRGGCIIRAGLLDDIRGIYNRNPGLNSLLLDTSFAGNIEKCVDPARKVTMFAIGRGIPVLALNSCLGYFDAYRRGQLPLNLIQAQRDYFGSHTYERTDREGIFHTKW